ncbi:hypothetical protein J6590_055835 [Homalodisca vitripennis]|nr:hypothetical protein J6590_055835 [Homalodisca vitripennis]
MAWHMCWGMKPPLRTRAKERLLTGIHQMKQVLVARCVNDQTDPVEIAKTTDKIVKTATKVKVAGQTTEFVNKVLDKVKQGTTNGGLDEL